MSSDYIEFKSSKYGRPTRKVDFGKLTCNDRTDKINRRVIPYHVNIVRRGGKVDDKLERDTKYFGFYLRNKSSTMVENLDEFLSVSSDLPILLHESCDALRCATKAIGVRLYMVDSTRDEIYISNRLALDDKRNHWKIEEGTSLAAYVAYKKEYMLIDDLSADSRFPQAIPYAQSNVKSVLCVPVVTPGDECLAVIELCRDWQQPPFRKADLKICVVVTGWMGASIYMNQQRMNLLRMQRLNEHLIELTKSYFGDTLDFNAMIDEVVLCAKESINGERTSFFVIDRVNDELVAEIFEEGFDEGHGLIKKDMKIRFETGRGIAGYVAETGHHLNIRDAYNDPRFNRDVDGTTGYITRNILCMPIMGLEGVLGVVQIINKIGGPYFTTQDEDIFQTFSIYCALALHYSQVCKQKSQSEVKYEVILGLLKRHVFPCIHDLESLSHNRGFYENPEALREFSWYIIPEYAAHMPQIALHMILEIVGPDKMDVHELMKFILTIRNFYRHNPYHNWEHGFNVCHCMYAILIRNKDIFTEIELKGLIVAALTHDVDHGGVTNNFLSLTNDFMFQLYEDSTWENHHYTVTMIVLSQIHIYKNVDTEEFLSITQVIKEAILSTDLAYYFKVRARLTPIVFDESFNWDCQSHRSMIKSIMMTVCDLSGQCKPYSVARRITDALYDEFYLQGDMEKKMGITPLSMMDREKQSMIPEDQVQFLNVLVLPCCDLLQRCLPNTEDLLQNTLNLRETWLEIIRLTRSNSRRLLI